MANAKFVYCIDVTCRNIGDNKIRSQEHRQFFNVNGIRCIASGD